MRYFEITAEAVDLQSDLYIHVCIIYLYIVVDSAIFRACGRFRARTHVLSEFLEAKSGDIFTRGYSENTVSLKTTRRVNVSLKIRADV